MLKRLWADSQTKALAYVQGVSSVILLGASQLHDAVTSPTISAALSQLTLPKWFPIVLLLLAGLTYVAHGHGDDA